MHLGALRAWELSWAPSRGGQDLGKTRRREPAVPGGYGGDRRRSIAERIARRSRWPTEVSGLSSARGLWRPPRVLSRAARLSGFVLSVNSCVNRSVEPPARVSGRSLRTWVSRPRSAPSYYRPVSMRGARVFGRFARPFASEATGPRTKDQGTRGDARTRGPLVATSRRARPAEGLGTNEMARALSDRRNSSSKATRRVHWIYSSAECPRGSLTAAAPAP